MSETVADPIEDESQDDAPEAQPPATPPGEDVATIKRRLAGKDQALSRTTAERDELKAEADRLRQRVLDYEQANMTETQRLQAAAEAAEKRAIAAEATAQRERLARKFPNAFEALGEHTPLDEDALAALEKRLSVKPSDETDDEPIVDPNSPRRSLTRPTPKNDYDSKRQALVDAGNPYYDENQWK